jgi:hypothetical protein
VRPEPQGRSGLAGLTAVSLLASVRLLVEARSVELLVEQLYGIPAETSLEFIQELIKQPHSMDADEVIQVAYGLLMYFIHGKEGEQTSYQMFDIVDSASQLKDRPPLLVIAAHRSYPRIIPFLLSWAQERGKKESIMRDTLHFVADNLDLGLLKTMALNGALLTPEEGAIALWDILDKGPRIIADVQKDEGDIATLQDTRMALIKYLINKKPNLNFNNNGQTLLMRAAYNNDAAAIRELVKAGANVNLIVRDDVGSALQQAIDRESIDAELVLRELGAQE